jgi:predicted unusual protein kinase regulating ubiquinone biosynthesis (AarF/ABC1/UbiB family)
MPEPLPGTLRSLIEVGAALARRTASGRVLLARYAPLVDDAALPEPLREPVRAELDAAWAQVVEPLDLKAIEKAVPKSIKGLAKEPLAVTPTAQVHAAELDGDAVAVKVARPGVAATIRGELALLDTLAGPLRIVFGALDVRGVLREARESVMDELDLEHEAETQQRVGRALRRLDGVTVPAAHVDECAPNVMVSELLEGPTLAASAPDDPERVAELLVAAHLAAWRDVGLVLTDARPSHVILRGDGIGLLGTGLARPVARERMDHFLAAFAALSADDEAAFAEAVSALELLDEEVAVKAFGLLREVLGEFVEGEATLDAAALERGAERAYERIRDLLALGAQVTPDPADLAAGRMAGQLTATLARLEVRANWPELVTQSLR